MSFEAKSEGLSQIEEVTNMMKAVRTSVWRVVLVLRSKRMH